MAQNIDWLHSRASLCKVNLYSQDKEKGDKERKLVCFVDVSSLNAQGKDQKPQPSTSQSCDSIASPLEFDLEEKEIIVIKDENKNVTNTEGAVCFFKHGHSDKGNVVSWLSNDLQKYAIGFQHALTPLDPPQKAIASDSSEAGKILQDGMATFNCPGA